MLSYVFDKEAGLAAVATFDEHVRPVIEERRVRPGNDLISALTTVEVDGERMTDEDILGFARLMFPAGATNTFPSLGNVLTLLLRHPDVLADTVGRPDDEVRWVIEEALRLQPAVCEFFRLVVRDTEWRGYSIPAGTPVITSLMAANRDPAVFDDPDVFDVRRRPQNVLTFGLGTHHCIGVHLARAEMAAAVRVLLARLPGLRVAEGEPPPEVHGSIIRGPLSLPVQFG
jgi:cytochrome P450